MTDTNALVQGALDWLLDSARPTDTGLAWPDTRSSDEADLTLYSGTAGTVLTLLEAHRHFGDDRYADAARCQVGRGRHRLVRAQRAVHRCRGPGRGTARGAQRAG